MISSKVIFAFLFCSALVCGTRKEIQPVVDEQKGYIVEEFARNLEIPWSIVFTDSNRILVTERPGL